MPTPLIVTVNIDINLHVVVDNTQTPTAHEAVAMHNDAADLDLLAHIYSRSILDPETGCRRWTGSHSSQGSYGTIWHNNKCEYVHRAAYEAYYGELPEGSLGHESDSVEIHHRCGVRDCCEITHLEVVTRRQHNREHQAMRQNNNVMQEAA
jgi:HNH endonuclease